MRPNIRKKVFFLIPHSLSAWKGWNDQEKQNRNIKQESLAFLSWCLKTTWCQRYKRSRFFCIPMLYCTECTECRNPYQTNFYFIECWGRRKGGCDYKQNFVLLPRKGKRIYPGICKISPGLWGWGGEGVGGGNPPEFLWERNLENTWR